MWVSSRLLVYDKIKLNEFYLLKRFNLNKTLSKSSISTTTKINTENEVRENKGFFFFFLLFYLFNFYLFFN